MKRILYLSLFVLLAWTGFSFLKEKEAIPDYAQEKNWIALPWRKDAADTVPKGSISQDQQSSAEADVFYVHPTMHYGAKWNASLKNRVVNKRNERCVIVQASAFNAAGKIYAPRYRQATLKAFGKNPRGKEAIEFAYGDVKAAFEYYLKNWNKGRPIILAGHSQGAKHVIHLLQDFFDGKDLQKQLVAAYPIGFTLKENELKSIPIGENPEQTGCAITWNTMKWGTSIAIADSFYAGTVCVNPLSWKRDTVYVSGQNNPGGVPINFKRIDKNICDAKCSNGLLWIHPPKTMGYGKLYKSYHVGDISLFYFSLRENAVLRVKKFLEKNKTKP